MSAIEEARCNLADRGQRARLQELVDATEVFVDYVVVDLEEPIPKTTAARLKSGSYVVVAGRPNRSLPNGVWLPEKDRPILFAAVDTKSTHLLTVDVDDFGRYFGKRIEGVLIVHAPAYLRERGA